MKNVIKNENFSFAKKYTRYEKNIVDKIVHLKMIYKIYFRPFSDRTRSFRFNCKKNVIKNEKFHFAPNLCEI